MEAEKLRMEVEQRVVPAAGRLVESLRVAVLVADEAGPALADEFDRLHDRAITLTEQIATARDRIGSEK